MLYLLHTIGFMLAQLYLYVVLKVAVPVFNSCMGTCKGTTKCSSKIQRLPYRTEAITQYACLDPLWTLVCPMLV